MHARNSCVLLQQNVVLWRNKPNARVRVFCYDVTRQGLGTECTLVPVARHGRPRTPEFRVACRFFAKTPMNYGGPLYRRSVIRHKRSDAINSRAVHYSARTPRPIRPLRGFLWLALTECLSIISPPPPPPLITLSRHLTVARLCTKTHVFTLENAFVTRFTRAYVSIEKNASRNGRKRHGDGGHRHA